MPLEKETRQDKKRFPNAPKTLKRRTFNPNLAPVIYLSVKPL